MHGARQLEALFQQRAHRQRSAWCASRRVHSRKGVLIQLWVMWIGDDHFSPPPGADAQGADWPPHFHEVVPFGQFHVEVAGAGFVPGRFLFAD